MFLVLFSTVSYAAEVKIIRGIEPKKPEPQTIDIIKEKPPETTPEKKGTDDKEEIIALAVNHCLKIESSITEHFRLIRAYNDPMQIDMMMPDFGLIFGQEWSVTTRAPRTKFNAIMLLTLSEKLGFRYGGYKFHDNCKAALIGKITHKNNFNYAKIKMPLAFDTNEAELQYQLEQQDGYYWIISDILINGESISAYKNGNVANTINSLCSASSFGTLICKPNSPESGQ